MFNIQQTEENKAVNELQKMNNYAIEALDSFISSSYYAYNTFWYGQVSPVEKMKALGTEAAKVFQTSADAQTFIKSQKPDHEMLQIPEGYSITWNEDGSGVIIQI